MSATRYAVSVRRSIFIKSIQNIQREQIKSSKRQTLFNSMNPLSQVHRMKSLLQTYNIQYFGQQILEILACVARLAENHEFCIELKSSHLLQDLFQAILEQLKRKPYIESPKLVEVLICTTYELVVRASYFLQTIEENLDLLLFGLHKYPLNNKIVEKVAGLINYTQLANTPWKQQYLSQKISDQKNKIIHLMQIYILRDGYQNWSGSADFVEFIERGELRWLKNAIYVFQISYSLLLMSPQRHQILKAPPLRQSLAQGFQMYAKQSLLFLPLIEEETSDCEFWSDQTQYLQPSRQSQQLWSYWMILLLDVCLLREQVISEHQVVVLKEILQIALQQLARSQNIGQIAIKIIKILYEQVILDEDDLGSLADQYPSLRPFAETIVNSDFL